MINDYHHANLSESALSDLKQFEDKLGKVLVAFEPDSQPAELTQAQLDELQALESKLGLTIVAYPQDSH